MSLDASGPTASCSLDEQRSRQRLWDRLFRHLDLLGDHNPIAMLARYHWNRVLCIVRGEPVSPLAWELDPSGVCNLHCSFCLFPNDAKQFIDTEHFLDLVRQARQLEAKAIIIAGDGEPLVHKGIDKMLRRVREEGLDLFLFTNGTLIGHRGFADSIVDTVTMIIGGIYGGTRESFRATTRSDSFDAACGGFREVIRRRNARGSKTPVVVGGWVADGANTDDLDAVVSLGEDIGFDWMYLRTDVTGAGFQTPDEVYHLHNRLRKLKYERFADTPNFVQARTLFDRRLRFPLDDRGGEIALVHPGAEAWNVNDRWWTWNDIVYVGPNEKVRFTNRTEVDSGSNEPFVIGSTREASLRMALDSSQSRGIVDPEKKLNGQVGGRKSISNLFYNLLASAPDSEVEKRREAILRRYPRTEFSDTIRNYF